MAYWLMKSEPDVFSVDDLARSTGWTTAWEGVRNYQVRNMMRDEMQLGDLAFFYHSSCPEPGIAGIMRISRAAYPDDSAIDPASPYFDPRCARDSLRWLRVDVTLVRKLSRLILLAELRQDPGLRNMRVLSRGNRLSITPVTPAQWARILELEGNE